MIQIIKRDLQSYQSYPDINSINKNVKIISFLKALLDIDFRAIFIYRLSCYFISKGAKKIGFLLYFRLKSAHAIDISPFAKVGPGFKIIHAFNIVIGPGVIIGENCVCFNSITLGNSHPGWKSSQGNTKKMPVIGERVILCPGVRVIGDIILGDDVLVGANAVVLSNIPDGERWAGIPAKKVSENIY